MAQSDEGREETIERSVLLLLYRGVVLCEESVTCACGNMKRGRDRHPLILPRWM